MSRWVLVLGLAACGGSREQAFESAARQLNPILVTMKADAATLEELGHDAAIVRACRRLEPQLEALNGLGLHGNDFKALDADERAPFDGIRSLPGSMRSAVSEDCDGVLEDSCASWCLSSWSELVDKIEVLRRFAREEGVEIVSLRTPRP